MANLKALPKEEVKAKAELSPACPWSTEGELAPAQRMSWAKVGTNSFKVLKEISVQSLAYYQIDGAETSVAVHDKEHTLYKISPGKSLNKQQQQQIQGIMCKGGTSHSQS